MSHQGNVVVKPSGFIFTTGRNSGQATALIVHKFMQLAMGWCGHDEERWLLQTLCKDDNIERPVTGIGNADTPTVIVDFDAKTVTWQWDHAPQEVVGSWGFEEYAKGDWLTLYREHFDQ